jgi:DNA-binding NtrC family response regulator
MDKEIHILMVEDSAADAELITRELGKADFAHTVKWVKSREEFLKALGEYTPDIILCDYKTPSLDAPEALEIVKERSPNTPFIVVSGTIGEDIAVEMMKLGAVDYVMKDKRSKLVPALQRALKEAQEHAKRQSAETSLKDSEERLKILFECAPDGYYLFDAAGTFLDGNNIAQVLSGYQK